MGANAVDMVKQWDLFRVMKPSATRTFSPKHPFIPVPCQRLHLMKAIYYTLFVLGMSLLYLGCATESSSQEEGTSEAAPPSVVGEPISYSTDSTTLKGYISYDENMETQRPGILVVHEWWGHNEYARMRADMLAELGYVALAVDMYGDGQQADHPEDAQKFAGSVMQNLPAAKARFMQAMKTLKSHPMVDSTSIAAIGYCFGGSVAMTMANAGMDLDAVAAFHSGVQLPVQPDSTVDTRYYVFNGADDPFVTDEQVEAFKRSLDEAGINYVYMELAGAVHGFTNPAADSLGQKFDMPLAYNEEADEQSWSMLKSFLEDVF